MGVYYSSAVAWGLRVKQADIPAEDAEEWLGWGSSSVLPPGFSWGDGGNQMYGHNLATIIYPDGMWLRVSDSRSYGDEYGVFKLEDMLGKPTKADAAVLAEFASEHGVPADIGWFAISSVY